ncbi:hypothetical protein [Candidatus Chloroploca sp. Khr17]|uniref:hypothetical protein n=1 Tax=Candidatus Chloroploca sp. Khr17 TaxID=2496869 RepID=UPI0013EC061B|nr:hypothetical protein [Candidatus Chloroploca sp. Khr17]
MIQSSFPDLYEKIGRDPTLLRNYERVATGRLSPSITQEQRDEMARHGQDRRLLDMLNLPPFAEQLADDELRDLVYQSMRTLEGNTPA